VYRLLLKKLLPILAGLSILSGWGAAADAPPSPASFVRDVAPILVHHCQACHGPKTAESNYRVDSYEFFMQPGDSGVPPVTPGKPDESEIHELITAEDADQRMPNNGSRLSDDQIRTIGQWIEAGAKFDGHDPKAPLREEIPRDLSHAPAPEVYSRPIPVTALIFSPDGKQLVTGGYHELLVWDAGSGSLVRRIGNMAERTYGLDFSADGKSLAIGGGAPGVEGELRLVPWTPDSQTCAKVLTTREDVCFDVAFRPDGKQAAAGGTDGVVRVFDVVSGAEKLKIESHADWVTAVCYSPDGNRLATTSRDKSAKVFDAATGALIATHSDHEAPVRAIAFAPDGKSVISAGDKSVHVWNPEDGKSIGEMGGFGGEALAIAVRGELLVAGAADRSVREFRLADRKLVRTLPEQPAEVLSVAVHEGSHCIACGCLDGTLTIFDSESGGVVKQFKAAPVTLRSGD
jgi:WD40 repeat protein